MGTQMLDPAPSELLSSWLSGFKLPILEAAARSVEQFRVAQAVNEILNFKLLPPMLTKARLGDWLTVQVFLTGISSAVCGEIQYYLVYILVRQASVCAYSEKLSGKGSKWDSLAVSLQTSGSDSQKMESLQYWVMLVLLATLKQEGLVGTLTTLPYMKSLRSTSKICLQKQFQIKLTRIDRLEQDEIQTMFEVLPAICYSWVGLTFAPMPIQNKMIPFARALSAAYLTESQDTPSVITTKILGTPFGQFAFLISATLALIARPVLVPLPRYGLLWMAFKIAARLLPQQTQGSKVLSQKWIDIRLRSSQVWLAQVSRKLLANQKGAAPMLPDQSTRKLMDWYLLQRVVTESIRYALCKHSGQLVRVCSVLSQVDMSAQLLKRKLFQKVPPKKSLFILYLAIQSTAVLIFILRLDQVVAQLAFFALQVPLKLVVSLFKYPVITVEL